MHLSKSKSVWNLLFLCTLLGIFETFSLSAAQSTREVDGFTCSVKRETQYTYAGWPGQVRCNEYINFIYGVDYDYDALFTTPTRCMLTDATTGRVLFNETEDFESLKHVVYTPDLVGNVSLHYYLDIVFLDFSECMSYLVTFNVSAEVFDTCMDAQKNTASAGIPRKFSDIWIGHCETPRDVNPKIFLDSQHNFTVQWLYNCSTDFPNNTYIRKIDGDPFNSFGITSVTYEHPGIYSCAVTYNNITVYAVHYHVCVEAPRASGRPTIRCQSSVISVTELGVNVTVECVATLGTGAESSLTRVSWGKVNSSFECFLFSVGPLTVNATDSSRHQCYRGGTEDICYEEPIPMDEVVRPTNDLTIRLFLINIDQDDLGTYTLQVRNSIGIQKTRNVTIVLEEDAQDTQRTALAIGLGVGLAVLLILVLVLLLVFRFYVAVFWKTHFAAYGVDDKQFGAYLSYHYSKETDVFAQKTTRECCEAVRSSVKSLGFSSYDEHEDGASGFRAENAINIMTNCHRVVIILSSEYVKDNWSVFELQQGFKTMIDSGSKMVFILLPGMKEYINQHAGTDDTYRMIKRAIKINYAIEWPCASCCCGDRFEREMRMALPKVRHSSSRAMNGDHPNGVDRFYSNTTAFTDISPGYDNEIQIESNNSPQAV